jgi:hypothetical protein
MNQKKQPELGGGRLPLITDLALRKKAQSILELYEQEQQPYAPLGEACDTVIALLVNLEGEAVNRQTKLIDEITQRINDFDLDTKSFLAHEESGNDQ